MDDGERGTALCAPFLAQLPVAGVAISVVSATGAHSTVGVSDAVSAAVDELQFRLGEGPAGEALRTGLPVLVPDLAAASVRRGWPVFAPAAARAGAGAMFSLPMFLGVVPVGVVSMHAITAVPPWGDALLQVARALTTAAAPPAVDLATRSAIADSVGGPQRVELRREVHQAAGMVMVMLDIGIDEALARLRARAFAEDRALDVVAREVVAGASTFSRGEE